MRCVKSFACIALFGDFDIRNAMWTIEKIKTTLEAKFEDSKVAVDDLTGTSDHFQVTIVSDDFDGLAPLERHRKVYAALGSDVGGSIHALSIKAYTNKQWETLKA